MAMNCKELEIPGVFYIEPQLFADDRGFFFESYSAEKYREHGFNTAFVQDNCSLSKQNTLRGMHYQTEPGQAKLVSVLQGEIYDVVVDMRETSPTYKKWLGVKLDSASKHQILVPIGCAHGFCVLSSEALVYYKVSAPYDSSTEKGFRYDDEEIGIIWPVSDPILSQRDREAPSFAQGVVL